MHGHAHSLSIATYSPHIGGMITVTHFSWKLYIILVNKLDIATGLLVSMIVLLKCCKRVKIALRLSGSASRDSGNFGHGQYSTRTGAQVLWNSDRLRAHLFILADFFTVSTIPTYSQILAVWLKSFTLLSCFSYFNFVSVVEMVSSSHLPVCSFCDIMSVMSETYHAIRICQSLSGL